MNIVILSGNLVKKPEIKSFGGDSKLASGTIAVSRDFKRDETDFINFIAFNQLADYLEKYSHKGDRVELVGHWQVRQWENGDKKGITNECLVERITCFKRAGGETTEKLESDNETVEELPDDLPF